MIKHPTKIMAAIQRSALELRHILLWILVPLASFASSGCGEKSFEQLPNISNQAYKAQPYISVAMKLQAMGRESATKRLLKLDRSGDNDEQIYILCRMLFIKRATNDFRDPYMGKIILHGGTTPSDWPLSPIEIIDGVPFDIVDSYATQSTPERGGDYLSYCLTNCDWNNLRFSAKGKDQLNDALNKLLVSLKWKRPLNPNEREFFKKQIQ